MPLTEDIAKLLFDNYIIIQDMNNNFKTLYHGSNNEKFIKWIKDNPNFIISHIYGNGYEDYYLNICVYKEGSF